MLCRRSLPVPADDPHENVPVDDPFENDALSGRGKFVMQREGNKFFLTLVQSKKREHAHGKLSAKKEIAQEPPRLFGCK